MDFDDFYHNGEPLQLPRPNAEVKYHGDDAEWTEKQVRGVICNPIYAGIGPYSALVVGISKRLAQKIQDVYQELLGSVCFYGFLRSLDPCRVVLVSVFAFPLG